MGYETKCDVRVDDRNGQVRRAAGATVLLETDELIVRGEARVRVPRTAIERVVRRAGTLTITAPAAEITLRLGADAAPKWEAKLQQPPKPLIDKLDVKPEARVWLAHVRDGALIDQLRERSSNLSSARTAADIDVAFVQVDTPAQLSRLAVAAKAIKPDGAIWAIHPKGPAGMADTAIFAAAKELGLTYTKVARVSEAESAEKLVWPRTMRAGKSRG